MNIRFGFHSHSWAQAFVIGAAVLICMPGCDIELDSLGEQANGDSSQGETGDTSQSQQSGANNTDSPAVYGETISIGSYNIQVFGQSKLRDEEAMEVLTRVVLYFDVVAIQEIRSKEQDVIPRFVERLNANGAHYAYVIGPRLGRTISKEQYAFVYDSSRVELVGDPFTVPDQNDFVHREPFVASFRTRTPDPTDAFSFTLLNIHTDPDETRTELNALDDMFRYVRSRLAMEDDFLLLGDFNVDENNMGELGNIPGLSVCIHGVSTNTAGTKAYDNILYDRLATSEFTGRAGVFPVDSEFGLDRERAMRVSDHFPVWAEFSAFESGAGQLANDPRGNR